MTKSSLHMSGRDPVFTSPVSAAKPSTPVSAPQHNTPKEVRTQLETFFCFFGSSGKHLDGIALHPSVAPFSYLVCPITTAASFQHNSSHRHCPVKAEADASWPRPQERVPASVEGRGHRGADDRQQPRNIWRGNASWIQSNAHILSVFQAMTFVLVVFLYESCCFPTLLNFFLPLPYIWNLPFDQCVTQSPDGTRAYCAVPLNQLLASHPYCWLCTLSFTQNVMQNVIVHLNSLDVKLVICKILTRVSFFCNVLSTVQCFIVYLCDLAWCFCVVWKEK